MGAGTQEKGVRKVLGKWKKPEMAESAKVAGKGEKGKHYTTQYFTVEKRGWELRLKGTGSGQFSPLSNPLLDQGERNWRLKILGHIP